MCSSYTRDFPESRLASFKLQELYSSGKAAGVIPVSVSVFCTSSASRVEIGSSTVVHWHHGLTRSMNGEEGSIQYMVPKENKVESTTPHHTTPHHLPHTIIAGVVQSSRTYELMFDTNGGCTTGNLTPPLSQTLDTREKDLDKSVRQRLRAPI